MSVVVVDYGMGNLRSVAQAIHAVAGDTPVLVSGRADDIRRAERLVLPGQGAMPDCLAELQREGLQDALLEAIQNRPLLGICVGMQMLLGHSFEGQVDCLNLIPGDVRKFELHGQLAADGSVLKVPQMGWNRVKQTQAHPMWNKVPDQQWFYFVHSYYAHPSNPQCVAGSSEYGIEFACAIARDNLFATQFHPEKSAASGLQLFANFLTWNP